jgi:hypothetical protein
MEGIEENLFNVTLDILIAIHAATSLGGADMNPVCGAIASAGVALGVDKRFEQQGTNAIGLKPIVGELMDDKREDFAGELLNLDPGKDKKSAVVDDAWEVVLASLVIPPDPTVPGRDFQSSTGKEQTGDNPV